MSETEQQEARVLVGAKVDEKTGVDTSKALEWINAPEQLHPYEGKLGQLTSDVETKLGGLLTLRDDLKSGKKQPEPDKLVHNPKILEYAIDMLARIKTSLDYEFGLLPHQLAPNYGLRTTQGFSMETIMRMALESRHQKLSTPLDKVSLRIEIVASREADEQVKLASKIKTKDRKGEDSSNSKWLLEESVANQEALKILRQLLVEKYSVPYHPPPREPVTPDNNADLL